MRLRNEDEELVVFLRLNDGCDAGTDGTVEMVAELRRSVRSAGRFAEEVVRDESGVEPVEERVDVADTTVSAEEEWLRVLRNDRSAIVYGYIYEFAFKSY